MERADTAGCREWFKLAVLLSARHRNKQFNQSSLNPFWQVVRSHWEKVTFFSGRCLRSCISHVNYPLKGQELTCTPASLFTPNSGYYFNCMSSPAWMPFFLQMWGLVCAIWQVCCSTQCVKGKKIQSKESLFTLHHRKGHSAIRTNLQCNLTLLKEQSYKLFGLIVVSVEFT